MEILVTVQQHLQIQTPNMFFFCVVGFALITDVRLIDADDTSVLETAIRQLLDARVNWQWGPYSNAEAILGITLSKDDWYQEEDAESYATVQAMEIELLAALSKDQFMSDEQWSRGKLAQYIGALQMTCRDPRTFYGHNLFYILKRHMLSNLPAFQSQRFSLSWATMAICNNGQIVDDVFRKALTGSPGEYRFGIDEASILFMALTCIGEDSGKTAARNFIVTELRHNISTINEYSKSLAVQALRLTNVDDVTDLIDVAVTDIRNVVTTRSTVMTHPAAAIHFLPVLAGTSLLDIGRTVCEEKVTSVSSGNYSNTITIQITVVESTVSNSTWTLTMGNGSTLFDALLLLQKLTKSFRFDFKQTSLGHMIYSINDIHSDVQQHTYWQTLMADETILTSGIDEIIPREGDHYLFRLATW